GTRIVYGTVDPWDTWEVPVLGGEPRLMLRNASSLTWIEGGRRLLFSEIKSGLHMGVVTTDEGRGQSRDVYLPVGNRAVPRGAIRWQRPGAVGWAWRRDLYDGSLVAGWGLDLLEHESGLAVSHLEATIPWRGAGTGNIRANGRRRDRDGAGRQVVSNVGGDTIFDDLDS